MIRANLCKICVISSEKRFCSGVKRKSCPGLKCSPFVRAIPNNYCLKINKRGAMIFQKDSRKNVFNRIQDQRAIPHNYRLPPLP